MGLKEFYKSKGITKIGWYLIIFSTMIYIIEFKKLANEIYGNLVEENINLKKSIERLQKLKGEKLK